MIKPRGHTCTRAHTHTRFENTVLDAVAELAGFVFRRSLACRERQHQFASSPGHHRSLMRQVILPLLGGSRRSRRMVETWSRMLSPASVGKSATAAGTRKHAPRDGGSARTSAGRSGVKSGSGEICQHQHIRSGCMECVGASICDHQLYRSKCMECVGAGICPHQRQRSKCQECVGASICQHHRRRSRCKECGGASICQHQRIRNRCKVWRWGNLPAPTQKEQV
jgi:hypothetical protein